MTTVPSRITETPTDNLFGTAMVLGLLPQHLSRTCASRAAAYLLARRQTDGLWSWTSDRSLPPDSDDTACCLAALHAFGASIDTAEGARILRRFWRWGGPFRTWLARGPWGARATDDAVVNCNVVWALQQLGADVRGAEQRAVARMVARTRGGTRYYCSPASVAWAAARAGIETPHLQPPSDAALAGMPLEVSLWFLAGALPAASASRLLLESQESDGMWPAEPWIQGIDGAWQSRAVSTAYVLAALLRILSNR